MIINNIEIEVIKKNIKNMHLHVLPPIGKVVISAPKKIDDEAIRIFAITKISWIKKQIEKFKSQSRQTIREYVSGESHYLFGRRYKLEVKYAKKENKVEIKINKIILTTRENSTPSQRENIINKFYRQELKLKLPKIIGKWEKIIGVKSNSHQIKNMKTRWGTCNVKAKRIWLNLQLAKKPVHCLEYIVVHELVHLLERKHTKKFIEYMDKFMPNWRLYKSELNDFIMDAYNKIND